MAAVTSLAIVAMTMAIWRARAARRGVDQRQVETLDLARTVEADRRLADDVAHELNDLLTLIAGHAERLIASLDPSGTGGREAHQIRRVALSASRLTKKLRTLSGDRRAPTDVNAVTARAVTALQPTPGPNSDDTLKLDHDNQPTERQVAAVVLVVEDEPGMREFIRLVLARAGHEVVSVAGPRAALDALKRQPAISLMLVDVVMPEMDGYEVAAEVRKTSPWIPVVFMSAFASDPTRHPSGDGFLAKPFTAESLTATVSKALSY